MLSAAVYSAVLIILPKFAFKMKGAPALPEKYNISIGIQPSLPVCRDELPCRSILDTALNPRVMA